MSDAPSGLPSAEYKQQCPDCEKVTSVVANYCPRCGSELADDQAEDTVVMSDDV